MKSIQQCRLIVICADACIPDDKLIKQTVFVERLGWVPVTHLHSMKYVVVDIECAEKFLDAFSGLRRRFRILPFYEVGEVTLRSIMSQWQKQINMQLLLIVCACWCRFDAPACHTHESLGFRSLKYSILFSGFFEGLTLQPAFRNSRSCFQEFGILLSGIRSCFQEALAFRSLVLFPEMSENGRSTDFTQF